MTRGLLAACPVLLSLCISSASGTLIVQTDNGGANVTGIQGLIVLGETYNVEFSSSQSFNQVFGVGSPPSTVPTFFGNSTGAEAAANAIATALSDLTTVPTSVGGLGQTFVFVPAQDNGTFTVDVFRTDYHPSPPQWTAAAPSEISRTHVFTNAAFATFEAVPEPSGLSLICAGLVGLFFFGLRTKSKTPRCTGSG